MATRQLYGSPFFEDDLTDPERLAAQRRQANSGVLSQSVPQVRTIANEPGTRRFAGHFDGAFAEIMAGEIKELLQSGNIDAVPYYLVGSTAPFAGWYEPERTDRAQRAEPTAVEVQRFEGTLRFKGTRRSHVRQLHVEPDTVTNPFGSATTEQVWLPSSATRPRWINKAKDTIETATVQATAATEYGDMDRFDVTEPTFDDDTAYSLIYDVAHDDEWRFDPRVWDDFNNDRREVTATAGDTVSTDTHVGTATVGEEQAVEPAWQRVYWSQHEYTGERLIENGHLRLEIDIDANRLRVYRWDDTDGIYAPVSPGNSSWELLDWDIEYIGLERVQSLTTWRDSSSPSTTAELVAEVPRGYDDVIFYEAENASSAPADLVTRLTPYAHDSDQVLREKADLLERTEIPDE